MPGEKKKRKMEMSSRAKEQKIRNYPTVIFIVHEWVLMLKLNVTKTMLVNILFQTTDQMTF